LSESQANPDISLPSMPAAIGISKRPAEIDWLKASDGLKLGYRFWQGRINSPVVLHLHGVEGHSQWFENTATVLNERGFTIYAPDRRGCGMNTQARGHIRNYYVWLSDLEMTILYIKRQHQHSPIFLMANCWGAKLAAILAQANYRCDDQNQLPPLAGLILTCPAIYTHIDFPLLTKIQIAFAYWQGKDQQMKRWPIPLTTSMLTNNPEYIDYLEKDPLRLTSATATFFMQTFFLTLKSRQVAKNIKTPTLILQAGLDEIVDIQKLENWYEQIDASQKSLHVFPESSHSLDFDRIWFKEYTHMLSEWIIGRA
jgi:acylglycerol lipase